MRKDITALESYHGVGHFSFHRDNRLVNSRNTVLMLTRNLHMHVFDDATRLQLVEPGSTFLSDESVFFVKVAAFYCSY